MEDTRRGVIKKLGVLACGLVLDPKLPFVESKPILTEDKPKAKISKKPRSLVTSCCYFSMPTSLGIM